MPAGVGCWVLTGDSTSTAIPCSTYEDMEAQEVKWVLVDGKARIQTQVSLYPKPLFLPYMM